MAENIIELVELTKNYGSFTAVNRLNLSVKKGEVFGLLGPNGAGKSTTILMMLGLTEPSSGSVKVCGINSTENPIEVKRRVGYLPEDVGFYPDLTGMENLKYIARLNGIPEKDVETKAREMLTRVGLAQQAEKKTGKYSRGMRQRLGLAEVLIKTPEVIILDEPTSGIDPTGIREFLELIVQLSKEEGLTVLFSSHNLHQVQQVCDRVGLFVSGKLIAEGNIESLSQKLFSNESFVVEAGLAASGNGNNGDGLVNSLQTIEGVTSVSQEDLKFYVGCSRDATADIAREIVSSGAELAYLHKKEYGLDDIYNRYFEGGEVHE